MAQGKTSIAGDGADRLMQMDSQQAIAEIGQMSMPNQGPQQTGQAIPQGEQYGNGNPTIPGFAGNF